MRCPRAVIPVAVGALWACADVPQAPVEVELRLAATDAWSGSELGIITPRVGTGTPTFEVFLDEARLDTRRTDDTTLVATLPDLPGVHRISAAASGATVSVRPDAVRLHGFEHAFDRAPLKGNLHVWPAGGRPMVLGVSATGPAVLDLASGTLREWPDTIHGAQCTFGGIGPSWRPDHFIFTGHRPGDLPWNCQPYRSRRLLPTLVTEPDAGPAVSGFQAWATGEIAPGRWVLTSDDHTLAFDCRSGVCVEGPDLFWTGGATQVLLSPRGDRALLDYFRPRMLDPESMTIAYRLEQYRWVVDAAFAPTGDTVFVAGQAAYPATGGLMQAIRTDDGAMLADIATATPGGTIISPSGVGLDPVGPWIYLAGEVPLDSLHLPALLVIDRASLRPAALLRAAEPDPWLWAPYDRLTIVPAPSEQAVYLVWETLQYDPPARPTRVYRFGRPP